MIMATSARHSITNKLFCVVISFIFCCIFSHGNAFSPSEGGKNIKKVIFKDGSVIEGHIVQMNIDTITIWTPDDNIIVRRFDDVERFVKDDVNPSLNNPNIDKKPKEFGH